MAIGFALAWAVKKKKKSKKKKGKSKKKSKKSAKGSLMDEILANYTDIPPEAFVTDHQVTCHIRLLNWDYLDFDLKVSEHTKLYVIAQKIIERHGGSIERLQLWRDQVKPHLQLTDMTESLEDVFEFEEIVPPDQQQDENAPPAENENGATAAEGAEDAANNEANKDENAAAEGEEKKEEEDRDDTPSKKKKKKKKGKKGKRKKSKKKKSVKKKKETEEEVKPAAPVKPPVEFECVIYYDFESHHSTDPLLRVDSHS